MDFQDPSDIAAMIGVTTVLLTIFAWIIRRWIRDQIETLILPHLQNDEVSVAKYAHDARDAAEHAGQAALDAKSAALDAKSAALSAADAADRTQTAVQQLLDRK